MVKQLMLSPTLTLLTACTKAKTLSGFAAAAKKLGMPSPYLVHGVFAGRAAGIVGH